jgi:hypothetical protein
MAQAAQQQRDPLRADSALSPSGSASTADDGAL